MIERDFNQPLHIAMLSAAVNMSPSSLHHHFKEITAMSPIRYQKQIRLQEARRLLLSETTEAADAGMPKRENMRLIPIDMSSGSGF